MKASSSTYAKKARRIRKAGKKTEQEFFGKSGLLEAKPIPIRVSGPTGKWSYFAKLDDATAYAKHLYEKTGRFSPVEYVPRKTLKRNPIANMEKLTYKYLQSIPDMEERHLLKQAYDRLHLTPDKYFKSMMDLHTAHAIVKRHNINVLKENPITVVGLANPQENPPRSVNANIEGIIYNRCIEIRAEKTGYKKGYYKHPFSRGSQVCIYALDNGDLLVHSKAGVKLWQPD